MNDLLGHSITYRVAVGPQAGRKAFTLQTVPAREADTDNPNLAKNAGFSLHAGVAANDEMKALWEMLSQAPGVAAIDTVDLISEIRTHPRNPGFGLIVRETHR